MAPTNALLRWLVLTGLAGCIGLVASVYMF
jgi:hypothetical protein